MRTIGEGSVVPFPAVFALRDARIHVSTSNCGNMLTYIKSSVNLTLGFSTILGVPNVNPDDSHVRFWRSFDDVWT